MELGTGFYIIIGVIVWMGCMGWVGNIQLAYCYQNWIKHMKTYESQPEVYAQKHSQVPPQGVLDEMIVEYRTHRQEGIEWVNTQAIIEKKVYEQQIPFFGLFRLPIGIVERIITQIPSWTIIMGLLGTFTGLTLALFSMQDILLHLGSDSGSEGMSISAILAAISEPFRGMSFAFITSIAGIGTAFLLHVLHSGLLAKIGVGPSYIQLKHLFLTRCESFLDHQVQLAVQKEKPKDSLERILDRLVDKVKVSFDESIKQFGDEIVNMTRNLEQSLTGLERVIEQSATFTAHFERGTDQLSHFGERLKEYIDQFQNQEEHIAAQVAQLSQRLQSVGQEFKQLSTKNEDSSKALQRVLERSDQMVQHSVRKSEEMLQFFQKQAEQLERQFQETMAEQERTMQQNQNDWFYRYQEKNDQFSRAAESFGQAVQHLERQWEDGLERVKRDIAGVWGQLLERYFGRLHQGSGDQELRELVREASSIQHLLEREFAQLHRSSQDMSQLLLNIYEWGRSQSQYMHAERNGRVGPEQRSTIGGGT